MFFLVPRGQGSANSLQRSQRSLACAEQAAGTQPWGGQTLSFFRFVFCFIYFLFNEPSLMSTGTSKPLPLLPQPSATSTRKTAKSDARQLSSGSISMFLPLTTPDSSRQRFTPSSKAWCFVLCSFTLQDLLFKSRNCKATMCSNSSRSPKGEAVWMPGLLFLFFLSFGVGFGVLWARFLTRAYGPLNINDGINLWVNFEVKGRNKKKIL